MPFFTQSPYLTTTSNAWLWVVLTVAFTSVAFGVFLHVTNRQNKAGAKDDGVRRISAVAAEENPEETRAA